MKALERNIGINILEMGFCNNFSDITFITQTT